MPKDNLAPLCIATLWFFNRRESREERLGGRGPRTDPLRGEEQPIRTRPRGVAEGTEVESRNDDLVLLVEILTLNVFPSLGKSRAGEACQAGAVEWDEGGQSKASTNEGKFQERTGTHQPGMGDLVSSHVIQFRKD